MLLNSHQLNCIVPSLVDTREHLLGKLFVGADTRLFLSHANVRLIYEWGTLCDSVVRVTPFIRLFGGPNLRTKEFCIFVLNNATAERRYSFARNLASVLHPEHHEFVIVSV